MRTVKPNFSRTVRSLRMGLFGATLLGKDVPAGWLARLAMKRFNAARVFCNRDDSLAGLHEALTARFSEVSVRLVGCVALFVVRK